MRRAILLPGMSVLLPVLAPAAPDGGGAWPDLPGDHAAHPDASYEAWAFAGHLEREDGAWYAFQVTFHRVDVDTSAAPDATRRWAFRAVYPASVAVTDLATGAFRHAVRVDRDGAGTAEHGTESPAIRQRAWRAWLEGDAWRIEAPADGFGLSLTLSPVKEAIAIGANGILTAGEAREVARRYAQSRLETAGVLTIGDARHAVSGVAWLDHVVGPPMTGGEAGWDLANVQLRDGAELALYRFRSRPGRHERRTGGAYVSASGVVMRLETLTTRFYPVGSNRWTSPRTGRSYPTRWRVEIPALAIRLDLSCAPPDQELETIRTHGAGIWRGSAEVRGTRGDAPITGAAIVEMVGYAGRFPPEVAEAAR